MSDNCHDDDDDDDDDVVGMAVVLMQSGEVYTFGSNQFGQLGTGDTIMR